VRPIYLLGLELNQVKLKLSAVCDCHCRDFNIVDAMMNKLDSYANDLEKKILERTSELREEQMKGEMLLYSVIPP